MIHPLGLGPFAPNKIILSKGGGLCTQTTFVKGNSLVRRQSQSALGPGAMAALSASLALGDQKSCQHRHPPRAREQQSE